LTFSVQKDVDSNRAPKVVLGVVFARWYQASAVMSARSWMALAFASWLMFVVDDLTPQN
jgi:hypothetical protein